MRHQPRQRNLEGAWGRKSCWRRNGPRFMSSTPRRSPASKTVLIGAVLLVSDTFRGLVASHEAAEARVYFVNARRVIRDVRGTDGVNQKLAQAHAIFSRASFFVSSFVSDSLGQVMAQPRRPRGKTT